MKEDPRPPLKLLITPLALQSIQLRSVKRREKDNDATESDAIHPQEPELNPLQEPEAQTLGPPAVFPLTSPDEESCGSPASSVLGDLSVCSDATDDAPSLAGSNGGSEDRSDLCLDGGEGAEGHLSSSGPPQSSQSSPVKQKPPAVSKKPQISSVPPFPAQPLNGHPGRDATGPSRTEDPAEATQPQAAKEEEDDKSELQQSWESCSSPAGSPFEPAAAGPDARLGNGPCLGGETPEEGAGEDGNGGIAAPLGWKEDDNGRSQRI